MRKIAVSNDYTESAAEVAHLIQLSRDRNLGQSNLAVSIRMPSKVKLLRMTRGDASSEDYVRATGLSRVSNCTCNTIGRYPS